MQPLAKQILMTLLLCMIAAAIAVTFPQTIDVPAHSKAHSDLFAHRATVLDLIHNRNFALKDLKIKYLLAGYTRTFITFVSIFSIVPTTVTFIRISKVAAILSATDPSAGRRQQLFAFGALALEPAVNGQDEVVTQEFLQATSSWLLDAAMTGCSGCRGNDGNDF